MHWGLLAPGEDPFLAGAGDALRALAELLGPEVLGEQLVVELLERAQLRPAAGWA